MEESKITRKIAATPVSNIFDRKLIFVHGKGGVGKTVVSKAIAQASAASGKRTLWVEFENPLRPPGELFREKPNLWNLNCEGSSAFEEYIGLKLKIPGLTKIFLQNKLMRYLSKAAPGLHELVLIGKVWFERNHYDQVVVDMLSTGYSLAMFQSTQNFAELFGGGPLSRDAESMIETFRDPKLSGHLIVSLPEEMPLRESLDLGEILNRFFPKNPSAFLVNRCFPKIRHEASGNTESTSDTPDLWPSPIPSSALDYAAKRSKLENFNLRLWRDLRVPFHELPYIPPENSRVTDQLQKELESHGWIRGGGSE